MISVGDWAYWLLGLGVVIANTALVYLAWWALFADRAKGRRRCPKCWYDMSHSPPPGILCPECGFTATRESQFNKTKRRYGVASGAILVSVVLSLFVTDRVTQQGFTSMLPGRVLLWILPWVDENNHLYSELIKRAGSGQLSSNLMDDLIQRAVEGDSAARPTSDEWIEKYGNVLLNLRLSLIDKPEMERHLSTIPPQIDVTTREVWPVGMPVTLNVQVRDWWPWGTECRVLAYVRNGVDTKDPSPTEGLTFYRTADSRFQRTPYALHVPPLGADAKSIDVTFEIDRRRLPVDASGQIEWNDDEVLEEEWERFSTQTITVQTRAEGLLDELAEPVNDEVLMTQMMEAFSNGVVRWTQGRSPVRFNVAAAATFSVEFNNTAVGVSVELLCDGEVARRLNMWWVAGQLPSNSPRLAGRNYGFEVNLENLELLRQADDDGRWKVRVRSDPQIALRAGAAKKYWQGEFIVPLKLQVRNQPAPPRPWRVTP